MDAITLSLDDVLVHVVSIGLDIYPQVEMRDERTRLNMFFEDMREQWPELYEQLTAGESEFKVSKPFRRKSELQGSPIPVDTFVLTQRGPVFTFPFRLPDPVGPTNLENRFRDIFAAARSVLWARLPGHTILRVGLVRDVTFLTGKADCTYFVSSNCEWLGSKLVGGHRLAHYRDAKCNIRLEFSPGRIGKVTQLPVGAKVEEAVGFGLKVRLDVNNAEARPLQDADIDAVMDRAIAFWPSQLLDYLAGVKS